MRILPILQDGVLDGVLHKVGDDPKVQELALKSLNVGKKTTYSAKEYHYFFKVIFETLIAVLENVWGSYSNTDITFVKIGDPLVKEYAFLSTIFHDLGCMFIFVRVQH